MPTLTRKPSLVTGLLLLAVGAVLVAENNTGARTPLPDPKPAPEAVLSIDKARIYNAPTQGVYRQAHVGDLEAGTVVVLGSPPETPEALGTAIQAAWAKAKQARLTVPAGKPAWLFCQGPTLNSPDRTTVKRLVRRGNKLTLEIDHTDVVVEGASLRRNVPHTPLVAVPLDLPAGDYKVEVIWKTVPSTLNTPDKAKVQSLKPLVGTLEFSVTP
jgi:hypothetical protein